jgi:hypothetical protein
VDRREFLRSIGKTGVAFGAAGLLGDSLTERVFANPGEKMPFIKLSGTSADMGRQYAKQAGDLIKERIKWMHDNGTLVDADSIDQSRVFLDISAEAVSDEVKALAAALDEKVQDIMILSAETPGVSLRKVGCSSFAIEGGVSKDGKPWAGENVDDAAQLQRFGVVIVRHPLEGPAVMTWALAGGMGAIGFNSTGLSLTMNYLKLKADKPPVAIYPEFIANCALRQPDFKNVTALLTGSPFMKACSFIVADGTGQLLYLERSAHQFKGIKPGAKFIAATNHFRAPDFARDDDGGYIFPDSKGRLARLEKLLDRKTPFAVDDLKKILADTVGDPQGISRHGDVRTIAGILMCPVKKTMLVCWGPPDTVGEWNEYVMTAKPERAE